MRERERDDSEKSNGAREGERAFGKSLFCPKFSALITRCTFTDRHLCAKVSVRRL